MTELVISKQNTSSGESWLTRVVKSDLKNQIWEIRTGPKNSRGKEITDPLADSRFIDHLLDTLRTIQLKPAPASATEENSGLFQPRYSLRWKVPRGPNDDATLPEVVEFDLRLGNTFEDSLYCRFQKTPQSFDQAGNSLPIQTCQGAAMKMLEYIQSFEVLRQRTLSTFTSDDVDEIVIEKNRKPILYAQREGNRWTDRKHRSLSVDIESFLNSMTHLRAKEFLDGEKGLPGKKYPLEVVLFDRDGKKIRFEFSSKSSTWYAKISSRPEAAFEVHSEVKKFLDRVTWHNNRRSPD